MIAAENNSRVTVAVRCRPSDEENLFLSTDDDKRTVQLSREAFPKEIGFDLTFGAESTQEDVYDQVGKSVVDNALKGYNASVFAYGQTGSGKTHTMIGELGDHSLEGLIPRIARQFMNKSDSLNKSFEIRKNGLEKFDAEDVSFGLTKAKLEATYLEVYHEKCYDLLSRSSSKRSPLKVRYSSTEAIVEGLQTIEISSLKDVENVLLMGNKARTSAETAMNEASSRSHAIFTLKFTQTRITADYSAAMDTVSKIKLVDLAGSERVKKSKVRDAALKEAGSINKSLLFLGQVINTLSKNSLQNEREQIKFSDENLEPNSSFRAKPKRKQAIVPYRSSVLTMLLKSCLGGNSKTTMLFTVSPCMSNSEETMSTLQYAQTCSTIVNTAKINRDKNVQIVNQLKIEIDELRERLMKNAETQQKMDELKSEWHRTKAEQQEKHKALISETKSLEVQNENLLKANEEFHAKIIELEKQNKNLEESMNLKEVELKETISAQEKEKEELMISLAEENESKLLEQKNGDSLRIEMQQLQDLISATKEDVKKLKEVNVSQSQELQETNSREEELNEEMTLMKKTLSQQQEKHEQLDSSLKEEREKVNAEQKRADGLQNLRNDLELRIRELSNNNSQMLEEKEHAEQTIEELKGTLTEKDKMMECNLEETKVLNGQLEEERLKRINVESQLEALTKESENLITDNSNLVETLKDELTRIRSGLEEKTKSLEEITGKNLMYKETLQSQRTEIQSMEEELVKKTDENDDLLKQISELEMQMKEKLTQISKEKDEAEEIIQHLKTESEKHKLEMENHKQNSLRKDNEINAMKHLFDGRTEELEQTNNQLVDDIEGLKVEVQDLNESNSILSKKVSLSEQEKESFHENIALSEEKSKSLELRTEELISKLELEKENHVQTKNKMNNQQLKLNSVSTMFDTLQTEMKCSFDDLEVLQNQLISQSHEKEEKIKSLKKSLVLFRFCLNLSVSRIRSLDGESKLNQRKMKELESALVDTMQQCDSLSSENERIYDEKIELIENLRNRENDLETSKREMAEIQGSLEKNKIELDETSKELEHSNESIEELMEQLEEAQTILDQQSIALESSCQISEEEVTSLKDENNKLKEELKELKASFESLQLYKNELFEKRMESENEAKHLRTEMETLYEDKEELQETRQKNHELEGMLLLWREKHEKTKKQLHRLKNQSETLEEQNSLQAQNLEGACMQYEDLRTVVVSSSEKNEFSMRSLVNNLESTLQLVGHSY